MISEFVFHGVPQGFDAWGSAGDRYYESFYGLGDFYKGARTALVVEVRKDAVNYCSYYTYVRPQNVVAQGGRTGSYFGMSLKCTGQYCTDVYSLFQLFNKIYEEKIVGSILTRTGNTEKYLVASFSDADSSLKAIAHLAESLVNNNFTSDFEEIDASFTKQHATASVYYNLDDVNSEAFFNTTRLYGKVFVSPEYPSKDTLLASFSASEKQHQALKAEYEKQIAELQAENAQIPQLKSRLSNLESDFTAIQKKAQELQMSEKSLKDSNNTLDQQLKKVQREYDHFKNTTDIIQDPDRFEPSLNESLGNFRSIRQRTGSSLAHTTSRADDSHLHHAASLFHGRMDKKYFIRFILLIAVILTIVLIIFLWRGIKRVSSVRAFQEEKISVEQKYDNLNKENTDLLLDVDSLQNNKNHSVLVHSEKYPGVSFEIRDETNHPISGTLKLGNQYIIRCIGVRNRGEWKVDGCDIKDKKENPTKIKVTKLEKVMLSFYVNSDKVLSIEYKVTP